MLRHQFFFYFSSLKNIPPVLPIKDNIYNLCCVCLWILQKVGLNILEYSRRHIFFKYICFSCQHISRNKNHLPAVAQSVGVHPQAEQGGGLLPLHQMCIQPMMPVVLIHSSYLCLWITATLLSTDIFTDTHN